MVIPILEMGIGAILEMGIEGLWETGKRREGILHVLNRLGFNLNEPPTDFNGLYVYTLVEYGVGKPKQIIDLFRHEIIKEAFRCTFEQQNRDVFDTEIEAFLDSEIGQNVYNLDYDPRQELIKFQTVFNKLADRARTVSEVRQDLKLEDIHQAIEQVLYSLEYFSTRKSTEELRGTEQLRSAELVLRMVVYGKPYPVPRKGKEWIRLQLDVAVTSNNAISSENGALRLTIAWPIVFSEVTRMVFSRAAHFEMSTGLSLPGYSDIPHAQSMKIRWGANQGTVIFPGDWHNFYGNPVSLDIPDPSLVSDPTYLLFAELFTVNSPAKATFYSIQRNAEGDFTTSIVDPENYHGLAESFWETYHLAREKLKT